jgi:hypothetical protein
MTVQREGFDFAIAAIIIGALGSFITHNLSYVMYTILIFMLFIKMNTIPRMAFKIIVLARVGQPQITFVGSSR